jgi:hypothetical protein
MSLRADFGVLKLVEGFAAMRERLVCEERLRLEAPGTEPCFPCKYGGIFGASRSPVDLGQCAAQSMPVCGEANTVSLVDLLGLVFVLVRLLPGTEATLQLLRSATVKPWTWRRSSR